MSEIVSTITINLITGAILLYIEYRWFVNNRDNK